MRIIVIALVAAIVSMACSKSREPQVGPDAALANTQQDAGSTHEVRPNCPDPEPCPACQEIDAVHYTVLHRIEHGRPESFVSTSFVHRAGKWYRLVDTVSETWRGPSSTPMDGLATADAQLAHVRAHSSDVGLKTISGDDYVQRGRMLVGWQTFDDIEDAPGVRISLASVFVLLE